MAAAAAEFAERWKGRRYERGKSQPFWIVTCNFSEFLVYDMEQPNGEPEQILLENLGQEYYRLMFLVYAKNEHLSKEMLAFPGFIRQPSVIRQPENN